MATINQAARQIAKRRFTQLVIATSALLLASFEFVSAAESFPVKSKARSNPDLTIHLPEGWRMATSEEGDAPDDQFVFEAPGANETYVFCRIERCTVTVRDEKLKSAFNTSHLDFLAENEANVAYFDPRHFVAWKRTLNQNFVVVEANLFGEAIYHFKFFTPRKEFRLFKPVLQCIVENIEVHGTPPQIGGIQPDARSPLSEDELKSLFHAAENPGSVKYFWMAGIAFVIVALFFIERTIRLRRHEAEMEELDRQIAERKAAKKVVDPRSFHNDASAYTRSIGKR